MSRSTVSKHFFSTHPHWTQVKKAFGGDPANPARPAVLVGTKEGTVTLRLLKDGEIQTFPVGEPKRFAAVIARADLCRYEGGPLVLVNPRYRAMAVAAGLPVPPSRLVVSGMSRLEGGAAVEIPAAGDGQPRWFVFTIDEVEEPASTAGASNSPAPGPTEKKHGKSWDETVKRMLAEGRKIRIDSGRTGGGVVIVGGVRPPPKKPK